MRAAAVSPGWSRFRHARQAGWRTTARLIRRTPALEQHESALDRLSRLYAMDDARAVGDCAADAQIGDPCHAPSESAQRVA